LYVGNVDESTAFVHLSIIDVEMGSYGVTLYQVKLNSDTTTAYQVSYDTE